MASTIEAERAAVEKRSEAEEARWEKQKEKLEAVYAGLENRNDSSAVSRPGGRPQNSNPGRQARGGTIHQSVSSLSNKNDKR